MPGGRPGGYGGPGPGFGEPAPKPPNRALWWAVGGAVVLVLAVMVTAAVVVVRNPASQGTRAAPSTSTGASARSGAAADCGSPGESSTTPVTERVVAGPLSFPRSAAPGWTQNGYVIFAESALGVGLKQSIAGQGWQAHVEIGLTHFGTKISSAEASRRVIGCMAAGTGYARYSPRVEALTEPEAVRVDGVPAHRVTARILVSKSGLSLAGDVVTVVVIDSAPQAYFESDTPIGDTALAAVAQQVFEQLKVARDV
ncbi:hypothetical protein [Tsukamurella pseudospumae]|uniref:Uncharacterized protein n=1 Tax=Tsukamurella pseudospumae TaxID=239498 RepID=A0A137YTP6_9ACTN|nr:hypothetical protein [Tsukamurella pseudospumae]KXO89336.1 hypothetical protein AXK61_12115 [Tsukamurella pseudospumae]